MMTAFSLSRCAALLLALTCVSDNSPSSAQENKSPTGPVANTTLMLPIPDGTWMCNNRPCYIAQHGTTLTFFNDKVNAINDKWNVSGGFITLPNFVMATNWNNNRGLGGTFTGYQIRWNNQDLWTKVSDGAYPFAGSWQSNGMFLYVRPINGGFDVWNERGEWSRTLQLSPIHLQATDWNNITCGVANGKIIWSNGSVWTKIADQTRPNIDGYWNCNGRPCRVNQSGDNLTLGPTGRLLDSGRFFTPTHLWVQAWNGGRGLGARVQDGRIYWGNGDVWTR